MAATPKHAARLLGLDLDASLADVKRARRKMALRYHPDRCADKEQATRHMARINAAADRLIAFIKERSNTSEDSKSSRTADAQASEARSNAQNRAQRSNERAETRKPSSRADEALARFASASYASVLDRIGTRQAAPTIDISILGYQSAH